jgi:dolichyl-diphosphooligosaccharide--protein glycosyltransferase
MVRLMLVLAPVMCILGGIAVSASLTTYMKYLDGGVVSSAAGSAGSGGGSKSFSEKKGKGGKGYGESTAGGENRELVAAGFVTLVTFFLISYALHCVWATSEAYSSPSIVLSARSHDGNYIWIKCTEHFHHLYNFRFSHNL